MYKVKGEERRCNINSPITSEDVGVYLIASFIAVLISSEYTNSISDIEEKYIIDGNFRVDKRQIL